MTKKKKELCFIKAFRNHFFSPRFQFRSSGF